MRRSSNCSAYTDTLSVFVTGTASVPGNDACTVDLKPMFSCQAKQFERPDTETLEMMRKDAEEQLTAKKCDVSSMTLDVSTNLVGAQNVEYSAEKLRSLGMVSNCYREGNDPNNATHRAEARCFNQREMTDVNGNRVINTNMPILSNLSACDISTEATPQIYEDLRKVAALNVKDRGFTVDKAEDLACTFSILPQI
jgi:hypothetical protein